MTPWDEQHFDDPFGSGVDVAEASVSQAIYDRAQDALIVTLVPGSVASDSTSFTVRQLSSSASYSIIKDGENLDSLGPGADGTLTITTRLPLAAHVRDRGCDELNASA